MKKKATKSARARAPKRGFGYVAPDASKVNCAANDTVFEPANKDESGQAMGRCIKWQDDSNTERVVSLCPGKEGDSMVSFTRDGKITLQFRMSRDASKSLWQLLSEDLRVAQGFTLTLTTPADEP